jgi:tetratricopeptide (TPR) repeat protein
MPTVKNPARKSISLFLVAVTFFAGCAPPGPRALLQGQKLLEQGNFGQAIEKLRQATVLLGNTNAQAFNYLGLACHQAGQSAEAEKAYRRALTLNPDLAEARFNLGCVLLSQNQLEPAKTELTAYTLRRGNSAEGWLKLGLAQLRLSTASPPYSRSTELNAAEKSFEEVLHLAPQNPQALNGLGLVRLRRSRASEAADFFKRALKEDPQYPPAVLNLAIVAQQNLNEPQLALQKYREYLALKPAPEESESVLTIVHQLEQVLAPVPRPVLTNQPLPTHTASLALTNEQAPKPALVEHSSPVVSQKPVESPHTVTNPKVEPTNRPKPAVANDETKSNSTSPANQPVEVVQLSSDPVFKPAEDVAAASPNHGPSDPVLTTSDPAESSVPQKSQKRTFLQRINPLNLFTSEGKSHVPPTPLPAASLGQSEQEPESNGNAVETSARYAYSSSIGAVSGNRAEAERAFGSAVQAYQAGRLPEAIQEYQRSIAADPSFYDAQYNLGLAASQAGNSSLALTAYEKALLIRPESVDARYNFALVLKQANYLTDATKELERVLTISPNDGRAHLALGNLYAQQFQDLVKARQHYLKVLEVDPHNPQADAIRYWLTRHPR